MIPRYHNVTLPENHVGQELKEMGLAYVLHYIGSLCASLKQWVLYVHTVSNSKFQHSIMTLYTAN